MRTNEGTVDRVLRIIVGLVLIAVGAWVDLSQAAMWVLIILGIVLLITGIIGWCGLYTLFGISTKKKEPENPGPPPTPQA